MSRFSIVKYQPRRPTIANRRLVQQSNCRIPSTRCKTKPETQREGTISSYTQKPFWPWVWASLSWLLTFKKNRTIPHVRLQPDRRGALHPQDVDAQLQRRKATGSARSYQVQMVYIRSKHFKISIHCIHTNTIYSPFFAIQNRHVFGSILARNQETRAPTSPSLFESGRPFSSCPIPSLPSIKSPPIRIPQGAHQVPCRWKIGGSMHSVFQTCEHRARAVAFWRVLDLQAAAQPGLQTKPRACHAISAAPESW